MINIQDPSPNIWLPFISDSFGEGYKYTRTGEGVDVYVIDSGARITHEDFQGKVQTLYTFDGKDFGEPYINHGTRVISQIVGVLGVAKDVNIYSLRFNFTAPDFITAINTVLEHHNNKDSGRPSVLNMSFASPSEFYGTALKPLLDAGIVCVSGAGNSGTNELFYPASQENVINAGGYNPFLNNMPNTMTFGSSISLLASWAGIVANSDSDTARSDVGFGGSSVSSALVAGVMALILEGSHKLTNLDEVKFANNVLIESARQGELDLTGKAGTPNLLAFSLVENEPIPVLAPPEPEPTPPPPPPEPELTVPFISVVFREGDILQAEVEPVFFGTIQWQHRYANTDFENAGTGTELNKQVDPTRVSIIRARNVIDESVSDWSDLAYIASDKKPQPIPIGAL